MKAKRGDLALIPAKPEGSGLLDTAVIWKLVKVMTAPNGVANKFKWKNKPAFTMSYRPGDFFIVPADRFNVGVAEVLASVPDTFYNVDAARNCLKEFRKA